MKLREIYEESINKGNGDYLISDVVGKEDFLEEFKNCLFYEPNNPKDLASKVMCIIKDKNLLTSMSKANKVLSQDFSWENVVKNSGIINELNKFDNQNTN